jgi:hypothetical protein
MSTIEIIYTLLLSYSPLEQKTSMAEWIRLLTLNDLPLTAVDLNLYRVLICSCEEAIHLAYGTSVVLVYVPNNAWKGF